MDDVETNTQTLLEEPASSGVVQGGWGYVWAAYGVTWLFLIGYALLLFVRSPRRGGS